MSNVIFPSLPGLSWSIGKQPEFKTVITEAAGGVESRVALWSAPRWHFKLTYELLRDDATAELKTLMGFFLARQGKYDSFLLRDPDDCAVVGQALGIGDGANTVFPLVRSFGGYSEQVGALDQLSGVAVNGQPVAASIAPFGRAVTLAVAPPAGAVVTADFSFLFRVRFDIDLAEFEQFAARLWQLQTCDLVSLK